MNIEANNIEVNPVRMALMAQRPRRPSLLAPSSATPLAASLASSPVPSFAASLTVRAILTICLLLSARPAFSSGYVIGNGDDGGDLEGGKIIRSGVLIETRDQALDRLKKLGTYSVDYLGTLIPELEKSDIYLVSREIKPKIKDDKGLESSADGAEVYARTFAEPHASTRFFPAALTLNAEQLMALHIHEALHRSLPASVRENEAVVTKITLAISAADATIDRVRRIVASEVSHSSPAQMSTLSTTPGGPEAQANIRSETPAPDAGKDTAESAANASIIAYKYMSFFLPRDRANYPIDSLHSLKTAIHPYASGTHSLGLGMEFTYFKTLDEAFMGPLNLSASLGLANLNDYAVTGYVNLSLNTMAGEEIKNSPLGRDVTTIGVSLRRDTGRYYIADSISLSLEGEAKRKLMDRVETFHYGKVIAADVHAGAKYGHFEAGGFAELLLSDSFKSTGESVSQDDKGRFHILGAGPEFAYVKDALRLSASARWVIHSTPGVSLDEIGDLMGNGVGQGFVSAGASLRF